MNLKKFFGALLILTFTIHNAYADEGMWIINELNEQSLSRMKELGFTPDKKFIYDKESPSIANAVVIFGGGCTAITVSEEGLLFTNHHCGYGSLQKLSSVEHDYLKNGFISQNNSEELPVEGLDVLYLKETIDITDSIVPKISHIDDEYKRIVAIDSLCRIIQEEAGNSQFIDAEVIPFYSMNKFYLVVYDVYRDVRLVFAPPTSMGKFGGETDNWMWPRHTCDFSVFRVYANSDNMPAEYDENNRPYKPKFAAEVSMQGYQDNDYAMTIGFPGSTDRYLSSWGIEQRIKSTNEPRIEVRGIKQEIWREAMQADDAIRIKYASKYASSSNYWKNSIGMNRGLANLNIIERKQSEEAAFGQWAQSEDNKPIYGDVLDILEKGYTLTNEYRKHLTFLSEAFMNGTEIISLALLFGHIDNNNLSDYEIEVIIDEKIRPFFKDYEPAMDQKVLAKMLRIVKERVPQQYLSDIYADIDKKFKGDYDRYAAYLFSKTALLSEDKMIDLLKNKKKYDQYMKKDPAACLALSIMMTLMEISQDITNIGYEIKKGKRLHFDGLQKMYPDSIFYSDANFTMRISYGSTGGYHPYDAAWYDYYTTQKGLFEKEDPESHEFWIQPEILDLVRNRDFGPYSNDKGELQLCFLSNNDITGGNSGSPVFDKNGRVIGLAFDGNWEAMSGDIAFEPDLQRTISVDIRFVLWMIDKWGKCPRILDELKLIN
jgi:Peptidase S46.